MYFVLILSIPPVTLSAQNFDYLQAARDSLSKGNCEQAQKLYNVYKALENKVDYELESLIKDCKDSPKQFKIGELIEIEGKSYPIAYIDITGQHGWAIAEVEVSYAFSNSEKIDGIDVRPYLKMKILNYELLPSQYDFVNEDEFEYVFSYKSIISKSINGKYCTNIKQKKEIASSYNSSFVKMSYRFTFMDFRTGQKETLIKDSSNMSGFRSRSFVRISF